MYKSKETKRPKDLPLKFDDRPKQAVTFKTEHFSEGYCIARITDQEGRSTYALGRNEDAAVDNARKNYHRKFHLPTYLL